MRVILCFVLTLLATSTHAIERVYGPFVYNSEIPGTLFFNGVIWQEDESYLREALRDNEITTLAVNSQGGNVYSGLLLSGVIFDKGINIYIPRGAECASACSFIFFAGKERVIDGRLGVHQFSTPSNYRTDINSAEERTQNLVAEVTGYLSEFNTPSFVLEKMFQTKPSDMHYFDALDIMKLNTSDFWGDRELKIAITEFMVSLIKRAEKSPKKTIESSKPVDPEEVELAIKKVQRLLNKAGCDAGIVDGIWGRKTEAAAILFAKTAKLSHSTEDLLSNAFLDKLVEAPENFCPKPVVKTPKKSLPIISGYWKLSASCPNGLVTGTAILTLEKKRANYNNYGIRYQNTAQQYGNGTAKHYLGGRLQVQLNLVGASSEAAGNIRATLYYKNGSYRGTDSNQCKLVATKAG